jgi:hypothetical protein
MCNDCYREMQDKERDIINYVRDHPKCKVKEICEDTGAKERLVIRMIKEGRFIQTGVEVRYPCEKCGKLITKGRFCKECQEILEKQVSAQKEKLQEQIDLEKKKKNNGMFTRNMGYTNR